MKAKHLLVGLLALISVSAYAVPVTYNFSASWNLEVQGPLSANAFPPASTNFFAAGDSILGGFTYDSDAPLISGPTPSVYRGAITNLSASLGGYTISDPTGFGAISTETEFVGLFADADIRTPVAPESRNINGFRIGDWALENFRMFWIDDPRYGGDTDIVTSTLLPTALAPSGFDPAESRIALDFVDTARDQRHIVFFQNLTVTRVPEPDTFSLLGFGVLLIMFTMRMRSPTSSR